MSADIKTTTDLKYAQWNPFFVSLQKDLDEIKRLNKLIRKDTSLIEDFYSLINTLFNSHVTYSPKLQKTLDLIEKKIFKPEYQKDLKEKKISPNMINFQFKVIKQLERCFQLMVMDFESNGLMPQRIFTQHRPKGRALLG